MNDTHKKASYHQPIVEKGTHCTYLIIPKTEEDVVKLHKAASEKNSLLKILGECVFLTVSEHRDSESLLNELSEKVGLQGEMYVVLLGSASLLKS